MGGQLGIPEREVRRAFAVGCDKQKDFWDRYREMGTDAYEKAQAAEHPVIAILGRPYNAFTRDANMGIPLKFTTRGYSVIPFDMLPFEEAHIFDNMYWYYGQQDMKASVILKDEPNIFITYITNFSCAPDSFMLHYVKWIMGTKPFLVLELDSHSADAGVDTRVEAFLDIIEGYRSKFDQIREERYDNGLRFINNGTDPLHLMDLKNNRKIDIFGNKKVKMLLSNMGRLSTELLAASAQGGRYHRRGDAAARYLHPPDGAEPHVGEGVPSLAAGPGGRTEIFLIGQVPEGRDIPPLCAHHDRALPYRAVFRVL